MLSGSALDQLANLVSGLTGLALPSRSGSTATVAPDAYESDQTMLRASTVATDGTEQVRSLHSPLDLDWVKFTLKERSNVVIQTKGDAGDTEMWLYGPGPALRQLAYDNDGNGAFSRIARSGTDALEPGTYFVKVCEAGRNATVARYTLGVQAVSAAQADGFDSPTGIADNTAATAATLVVNTGPQTHSIHTASDVDWVRFTLPAQSEVVIETRGASGDTQIALYAAADTATPLASDDDSGVGRFSRILRSGTTSLAAGTYYVKVAETGADGTVPQYTVSVTALRPGDVLLVQNDDLLAAGIRLFETRQLGVAAAETFSHASLYLGNNEVAEMLAGGFAVTPLPDALAHAVRVDVAHNPNIGSAGPAVASTARSFANTPYAYTQFAILGLTAAMPGLAERMQGSSMYRRYLSQDAGAGRMICSELIARAYAAASVPLSVTLWPVMAAMGDTSAGFRMDFTTPTMLALSPDLIRLNA